MPSSPSDKSRSGNWLQWSKQVKNDQPTECSSCDIPLFTTVPSRRNQLKPFYISLLFVLRKFLTFQQYLRQIGAMWPIYNNPGSTRITAYVLPSQFVNRDVHFSLELCYIFYHQNSYLTVLKVGKCYLVFSSAFISVCSVCLDIWS